MSLNPGRLFPEGVSDDFVDADCMARYIEDAMLRQSPPPDADDDGKRGRRLFCVAISEGIIGYLREHDGTDFFRVHVASGGTALDGRLEIM
ncbi:MAG: hypothetical protein HZB53_06220 [Chloroflexi bacterium]|nr:hypothetical protein [Chloroflexota bacterium]